MAERSAKLIKGIIKYDVSKVLWEPTKRVRLIIRWGPGRIQRKTQ